MTTNQYIKQFPDLMAGKKIMYVHGFASSAQTGTTKILREFLPNATVIAYDAPLEPHDAIAMLKEKCKSDKPDLIIGTSMGGMYTEQLKGFDRILINPAFKMADTMAEHGMMGKQTFMNPRADGVQEFYVDKPLVKRYREVCDNCFHDIDDEERKHVFGLFGDEDDLVNTFDLFRNHYPTAIHFHGQHRMNDSTLLHYVIPVIRWIDDRQEKRERPIVYIHLNSVRNDDDQVAPSFHKAYEMLIEHYQVMLVDEAPTNDHAHITRTQEWVEKVCSAPAYDRVVFTNQKSLLYGDYFIDRQPAEGFMGSAIEFKSDDFKTWDDIITYFERLGGQ